MWSDEHNDNLILMSYPVGLACLSAERVRPHPWQGLGRDPGGLLHGDQGEDAAQEREGDEDGGGEANADDGEENDIFP